MEGELETASEVELEEAPAIETPQAPPDETTNDNDPTEVDSPEEGEEDPTEPLEEFEEFEWNGKPIKAPKGLKDGVLMHSDYTRKTQEVAQTRKELEQRAEAIAQQAQATEEELKVRATKIQLDAEIERFKDFDWNAYQVARQQDPFGADEAWNYKAHLMAQKNDVEAKLSEAEKSRSAMAQQEVAKRLHETEQFARSKGWTKETDQQVIEFALQKGANPQQLQQMMSPLVYEVLHLARLGAQLVNKPAPKPAQATKPLEVVGAKTNPPARKSLEDMSMEEYVAHRQKQAKR